ncbi:C6 transcription factor [Pseudozyma hubeiensis SY62]|uniref:C6 transcription factor n=1 Tax=Pseudozyma hubeiensis (strain SY62) TaxID=1305764 RepID=R9P312_PSEHS|nr:C6 transcription factor [Pseudozyma hubeiensis SY62]GAC95813.1 C6 transcription factor [Pseudozyma hubeiensis SY62]
MSRRDAAEPYTERHSSIDMQSSARPNLAVAQSSRSPEVSAQTQSYDDLALCRPQQQASTDHVHLRQDSPPSTPGFGSSSASRLPPQPQATLNMDVIQAQAEMLERQARVDLEETQRLAEQHFEEMLGSREVRVSHACEHCRQRKAKCSGQQPCQRCAKQGILCTYSKQERRSRPFMRPFDIPSQSTAIPTVQSLPMASPGLGPIRATGRTRDVRYANMSTPYGLRRNTLPCSTPAAYLRQLKEGPVGVAAEASGSQAMPSAAGRDLRTVASFPPSQQAITEQFRPNPIQPHFEYEAHRRDSVATTGSESFDQIATSHQTTQSELVETQHRPWTTESAVYVSATGVGDTLGLFRFQSAARHQSGWNNFSHAPALPATLSSSTQEHPQLPMISSSLQARQTYASSFRPVILYPHIPEGLPLEDERHRSHSLDEGVPREMEKALPEDARESSIGSVPHDCEGESPSAFGEQVIDHSDHAERTESFSVYADKAEESHLD